MANWVMTNVTVKGPEKEIDKIRKIVEDARKDQDLGFFNQLIPMPEGMAKVSCTSDVDRIDGAKSDAARRRIITEYIEANLGSALADGSRERFLNGLSNLMDAYRFKKTTGFASWYSWAIANWGCKWDVDIDGLSLLDTWPEEVELIWMTPWSLAAPVLEAMWKLFDGKCDIEGSYADEDIGSNCGHFKITGGECVTWPAEDPVGLAYDIWGYDRDELES